MEETKTDHKKWFVINIENYLKNKNIFEIV